MTNQLPFAARVRDCAGRLARDGVPALGALYDLTSLRLVRYAVTLTRNQHDAEDAVQTSLVRVASQPQLLATADHPWSYLLTVVRNEALLLGRRKRRLAQLDNLADLRTSCRVDEAAQEEMHRAVWGALRRLPAAQAEVVVLKIWEEMTFAEIAVVLHKSPHTVASRFRYAMQKLSSQLEKAEREVSCD